MDFFDLMNFIDLADFHYQCSCPARYYAAPAIAIITLLKLSLIRFSILVIRKSGWISTHFSNRAD